MGQSSGDPMSMPHQASTDRPYPSNRLNPPPCAGEYSHDFVQQFRIFTDELRDFFNAGSLQQTLDGVRPSLDSQQEAVLDRFLQLKAKVSSLRTRWHSSV